MAVAFNDLGEERAHGLRVADIARQRRHVPARGFDLCACWLKMLDRARADHDRRAQGGHLSRDGAPDASPATADHDHFAVEETVTKNGCQAAAPFLVPLLAVRLCDDYIAVLSSPIATLDALMICSVR
jgi:hypothetical protein